MPKTAIIQTRIDELIAVSFFHPFKSHNNKTYRHPSAIWLATIKQSFAKLP
jgi:hypothetical protein